jgi:hypothetical protein
MKRYRINKAVEKLFLHLRGRTKGAGQGDLDFYTGVLTSLYDDAQYDEREERRAVDKIKQRV